MDYSQLFSLFKGQDIKIPNETANTIDPSLTNLDLSNINQNVIDQVRKEYLSSTNNSKQEDQFKNVTSITPEVLVHLANMTKETNLLQVIREHKERQNQIEKELFEHRESIKKRYEEQKKSLLAKELIGIKDPKRMKYIEAECEKELHKMDLHVLKEMDKRAKQLQRDLMKLKVPLFKETNEPKEIKLQQKILFIIQDML
ncbi:hypothetical protein RO3G_04072 [Rhizopus delemar RA 99-880]|uniref:Uncharacterized protein n=1 Tax=Rhizopus delemar (strain RA 99-880 / ATCC MYA-4621 / FGSC 9543 / NRRL 43880) TaxID=246409 RepID=I1BT37_RHIO9|nr:hypothetical protein RO3G_04072 [Rhizopus delemar RA 99-880]|eukprot:EIE79367.1 hypothetical protein RO3G_04072 [Rhizopus delemar RA 99-880]